MYLNAMIFRVWENLQWQLHSNYDSFYVQKPFLIPPFFEGYIYVLFQKSTSLGADSNCTSTKKSANSQGILNFLVSQEGCKIIHSWIL